MLLVILVMLVVIFLSLKEGISVTVKRCFYYSLLYKLIGFNVSEIDFLILSVSLVTFVVSYFLNFIVNGMYFCYC